MVIKIKLRGDLPTLSIREVGSLTDIFGRRRRFRITKVVPILQSKVPKGIRGKVYVLQKLEFLDNKERYFRFGYYILGQRGRMRGKWVWGQYCPIGPEEDFKRIMEKARSEGFV